MWVCYLVFWCPAKRRDNNFLTQVFRITLRRDCFTEPRVVTLQTSIPEKTRIDNINIVLINVLIYSCSCY